MKSGNSLANKFLGILGVYPVFAKSTASA